MVHAAGMRMVAAVKRWRRRRKLVRGYGHVAAAEVAASAVSVAAILGITKATNAGINYTDKWGSKVDVTGSYFFPTTENNKQQQSLTQRTIDGDSVTLQSEDMFSNTKNQNHRFNFEFEYYIDSMNSLLYTPSLVLQHSETYTYDTLFTRAQSPRVH